MIGWALLVVAIVAGLVAIRVRHKMQVFSASLHRTVNGWRTTYHITDEQVNRIIAMEYEYHGNGNFLTKPSRTPEQAESHHREIAALMKPEDGARFLEDQKKPVSFRRH